MYIELSATLPLLKCMAIRIGRHHRGLIQCGILPGFFYRSPCENPMTKRLMKIIHAVTNPSEKFAYRLRLMLILLIRLNNLLPLLPDNAMAIAGMC